jgi:FMN reductase (NADPH)
MNPMQKTLPTTAVTETLNQHVSIRKYTDQPIADDVLSAMLNAARRSPTSSNMQAYTFIVVRDAERKAKLAELAGNQQHIIDAPVFVACCADVNRLEQACAIHETQLARNTENLLVATVDASLAGMSLATAAESFGLGTVMIGGIRNHPDEVGKVLGLPDGVYVVYGLCIGYPDETKIPPQKPRLQEHLIIHHEQYDARDVRDDLRAYDAELAGNYRQQGRKSPDAAWTGVIASKFSTPRRPKLRAILEKMGFSVE